MNKTAILSYIIDEVALKCRNVSSNMRKRIHWMLKYMEITVKKYDVRALLLNGWVRVGKYEIWNFKIEEMKKGISNYYLETQEQLDKLISLNNEIRCHELDFLPTDPLEIESIEGICIDQDNYEFYSECSFNKVKHLELLNLSANQIKSILSNFKRINTLAIQTPSLKSIDFRGHNISNISFIHVSLKEPIYLPKEIDQLVANSCEPLNLIKAQRVKKLQFSQQYSTWKACEEFIKTLRAVKIVHLRDLVLDYCTFLPSTVREINYYGSFPSCENLAKIIKKLPYLIIYPNHSQLKYWKTRN